MSWNPEILFYNQMAQKLEEMFTTEQTVLTSHRLSYEDYNYHQGRAIALREVAEEVKRLYKDIFSK